MAIKKTKKVVDSVIKLDLGCGPHKQSGFIGVDQYKMEGVDVVVNLGSAKWPWKDNSVDEAYSAHLLEHFTNFNGKWERTHFFNELYRVLKPGAKVTLMFPHWCSNRYYGDPTHCEPFSEMGFYYLSQEWRTSQAPHADIKWNQNGYSCNFEATWGYALRQDLISRNTEFQQMALLKEKEAAQDIIATLTKR